MLKNFSKSLAVAGLMLSATMSVAHADNAGHLYIVVDAVDSEYWNTYIQGAQGVANSVGKKADVIASNYNGAQLIAQFQALFSAGCQKCAIAGDASGGAFVKPWVERAEKAGASIVTIWSRPDNIHPWTTAPKAWVAHMSFDGVKAGYEETKALCVALKGKGNIAALKGAPDAAPAPQRIRGLKNALAKEPMCKNIKLLAVEVGNWEETKAEAITRAWIARFGSQLNGIMASQDNMARGAIAALKSQGLNGKVLVTGADGSMDSFNEVKSGDLLMTVFNDPVLQGATAMSIAYGASIGDIDPAKLSQKQRDFYMDEQVVDKSNVDKYIALKNSHKTYTYAQMKGHWFDAAFQQIPPNANDPKQDQ